MIKFRQKEYTILSGKYEGPKDLESVPGTFKVLAKSALTGAGIGGAIGFGLDKLSDIDTGIVDGALTGGKVGFLSGIALKMLLNTLHNPMSKVKYQEVDKAIRKQFGIIRLSGITIGDTVEKRNKLDDKYSFNDRNIVNYKINITVLDNKFTMYIIELTDEELDNLNKILDYYCKKYTGMNYSSKPLDNGKQNSYAIDIIFTNYPTISNFLSEVSDKLQTKINLLDNKAIVEVKTKELIIPMRQFSFLGDLNKRYIPLLDKQLLLEALSKSGVQYLHLYKFKNEESSRISISLFITGVLLSVYYKLANKLTNKYLPVMRNDIDNDYLKKAIDSCGLINGIHYTINDNKSPINMYMNKGNLLITSMIDTPEGKKMDKVYDLNKKLFYNKTILDVLKVVIYVIGVESKMELLLLLKKIISTGAKPNIYIP